MDIQVGQFLRMRCNEGEDSITGNVIFLATQIHGAKDTEEAQRYIY